MIIKASDITDLKVVTLEEGKEIARVKDIIYDPDEKAVKALLLDEGGWFSDAKVIPIENVENIGKDAVIVESDEVIIKASKVSEKISQIAKDNTYLTQTRILTEDGIDLGKVVDVNFDSKTGDVESLIVTRGGLRDLGSGKKIVKVSDIVTIGKDATIVKGYAEEEFKEQHTGGIQGMIKRSFMNIKGGSAKAVRETKKNTKKTIRKIKKR